MCISLTGLLVGRGVEDSQKFRVVDFDLVVRDIRVFQCEVKFLNRDSLAQGCKEMSQIPDGDAAFGADVEGLECTDSLGVVVA